MEFSKTFLKSKHMNKIAFPDLLQINPKKSVKQEFSSQGHADSFTVIHILMRCPLILSFSKLPCIGIKFTGFFHGYSVEDFLIPAYTFASRQSLDAKGVCCC